MITALAVLGVFFVIELITALAIGSLALLADATPGERAVLGAIRYHPNRAVLHSDASVLPRRKSLWSAWNYQSGESRLGEHPVAVHYLINRLQPWSILSL
jgi:predicted NAD/FAD-binding protein